MNDKKLLIVFMMLVCAGSFYQVIQPVCGQERPAKSAVAEPQAQEKDKDMDQQPSKETIDKFHQLFANGCNNKAWDLLEKDKRTPEEDQQMLYAAYASVYHWSKIGQPVNFARGYMLLAQVHAALGQGDLAMQNAKACFDYYEKNGGDKWELAFANAEMAYAAAVRGDKAMHAKYYAEAKKLSEALGPEDKQIFMASFSKMPVPNK
jgi:hypothetical protein